jgi:hypothetical protein
MTIQDMYLVLCYEHLETTSDFTTKFIGSVAETCYLCRPKWWLDNLKAHIQKQDWLKSIKKTDVVYISGPMTGLPDNNLVAFDLMHQVLRQRGCLIQNPGRYEEGEKDLPYSVLMRRAIKMLCNSSVIVMLDGWHQSKGAAIEYSVAEAIGLPIYHEVI